MVSFRLFFILCGKGVNSGCQIQNVIFVNFEFAVFVDRIVIPNNMLAKLRHYLYNLVVFDFIGGLAALFVIGGHDISFFVY